MWQVSNISFDSKFKWFLLPPKSCWISSCGWVSADEFLWMNSYGWVSADEFLWINSYGWVSANEFLWMSFCRWNPCFFVFSILPLKLEHKVWSSLEAMNTSLIKTLVWKIQWDKNTLRRKSRCFMAKRIMISTSIWVLTLDGDSQTLVLAPLVKMLASWSSLLV